MTRIAIVGGGQAGMPLALGLLDKGYDVTVATNRKPDEVRAGQVMSSQCIFDPALRIERNLGIDEWDDACPPVEGIGFAVPHPEQAGAKVIDWAAPLDRPAQAVDQRLKMPVWLERFAARGGNLLIRTWAWPSWKRWRKTTTWSSWPPARARWSSCSSATPRARGSTSRNARWR